MTVLNHAMRECMCIDFIFLLEIEESALAH